MRKLVFISGTISFSFVSLGLFFRFFHYPYSDLLLLLGTGTFALVFVPFFAKYTYDKEKRSDNK